MSPGRGLVLVAVCTVFVAGACASAATPDTRAGAAAVTNTSTTLMDMGSMDMAPMSTTGSSTAGSGNVQCAQHMPGDVLSAAEAMVIFDTEHVCLGYVTVRAGTAITWHNADAVERRVSVEDGNGTVLMSFSVPGGGAAQRSVATAGVYRYKVSAIESFVGTIEVQAT